MYKLAKFRKKFNTARMTIVEYNLERKFDDWVLISENIRRQLDRYKCIVKGDDISLRKLIKLSVYDIKCADLVQKLSPVKRSYFTGEWSFVEIKNELEKLERGEPIKVLTIQYITGEGGDHEQLDGTIG
ncbi:hypothetical protein NVP1170O_092 [Vibrio phage 1.170.O._10N.261.52.C3]|nr:hypothetical protein NVP1170O_092 [Vibrio phage 1.170.O._10N.261.52.C3]